MKTKEIKELSVYNQKGKAISKYSLDEKVFDGKVSHSLMHQAVVTYLANQRIGSAKTKKRGEVSGGGTKPWRQKGTGRARVGSIRSPLWRGGGVTFGPAPRDYRKKFPQRMKILALKSALNAKVNDNELLILDQLNQESKKTKDFVAILRSLKISQAKIRLVADSFSEEIKLATRNLPNVELSRGQDLTTYTAIDCEKILFEKESLLKLEEKVKKWL